ncbi:MAG: alpha/beta hydrolase [Pseudomonas gingeri]
MEAEQITLPSGKTATLAATHTLTAANDSTIKVVPVTAPKPVILFIGGAGDQQSYYFQGAFHNINYAAEQLLAPLDQRFSKGAYVVRVMGYNDSKGESDIQKNIKAFIPTKSSPIYIVGHSLGGWNGAHLSTILADEGYNVQMLVTLDPVGEGFWVWVGSDIYKSKPAPVAKIWINIRANPSQPDTSDSVANFGERWTVTSGPSINTSVNLNHAVAWAMFVAPIQGGQSARDLMLDAITRNLQR